MPEKKKKNTKTKPVAKQQKAPGPHRWSKGQSGNPGGRPKKPEIEQLREALEKVKKKKGKSMLEHMVERAYINDAVMIALAKKVVPDLSSVSGDFNVRQKILKCVGLEPLEKDGS